MRFVTRHRRQPPAIIIVSLIDILIVLLIFMMVTTTFKRRPMVKLSLPESGQSHQGSTAQQSVRIWLAKAPPYYYLGQHSVTYEQLTNQLNTIAARTPSLPVIIGSDTDARVGSFLHVMDAVRAAGFQSVTRILTRKPGSSASK